MSAIFVLLICSCLFAFGFAGQEMHKYVDAPMLQDRDSQRFELIIVYFGYISPKREHWQALLRQQLDEFNCNGLSRRAKQFYISLAIDHASETDKGAAELVNQTISSLREIQPRAIFDITLENRYEYPGIRTLWDVGKSLSSEAAENTIMIYMHSKGMVHTYIPNFHAARVPLEIKLFHSTFDNWDTVLNMYHKYPKLNKVGCFPAPNGQVWFNLFYARASYIQKLVNPTIAKDRYYYEHWLNMLDSEHYWPTDQVRRIEFADRDVQRGTHSGCADCWSVCQGLQNETLGASWLGGDISYERVNVQDWYRCRHETVLPRKQTDYSVNHCMTEDP